MAAVQFGIDVASVKGSIPSDLKLKDLSALRPIILNKGLTIVNKMAPALIAQVLNFENLCPPAEKLQKIIDKRNNIVDQANQIADFLNTIVNALTLASTALGIIVTIINVVKIAKQIIQVVAGFIPLSPGAIPSGIGAIGDALDAAAYKNDGSPRFPPLKAKIDGLLIPLGIVLAAISSLIAVLSNLDGAIAGCVTPIGDGGGDDGEGGAPGELLRGPVLKLKIENPGSQYEDGTYDNVKLKGGDGKGCRATIKISGNEVVKVTVTEGGDGYSTQLFDPTKGFKHPNFLYVKKGEFGKTKLDVKELLETIDLKKRIVKKVEKQKVKGDGMLLSVEEIGASQDTGGNNTGEFKVGVDGQGNIKNENLKKGGVGKIKVTNRGGGYPDGTYPNVDLGNGAVGTVVIQNNQLNDVVITDGGSGFGLGDGIQINLPPGSGAEVQVDGVKAPSPPKPNQDIGSGIQPPQDGVAGDGGEIEGTIQVGIGGGVTTGIVDGVDIGNGGSGYKDGIYDGQSLGGGSGNGLVASVTVRDGAIIGINVINGGSGYEEGDVFTIPRDLGLDGGDGITQDASVSATGVSATQVNPNTSTIKTNTGIVTTTIIPSEQYVNENKKLLAVLSGVPLSVIDENGNEVILPGLTGLDSGLQKLVALTQQAEDTPNDTSYNGFVLEIEERDFSPTLKQRRAVALNPSGIIQAATEFSFATNEGVLIEDLKLIIDEQNLRVTFADLAAVTSIESEVALPNE